MRSKRKLLFRKVYENSHQRFYEVSKHLDVVPNKDYVWDRERILNISRLPSELKKYHGNVITHIALSDSQKHKEKLVFVAIPIDEDMSEFMALTSNYIDGTKTDFSSGGDPSTVKDDEYYLKRLADEVNCCYHIMKSRKILW